MKSAIIGKEMRGLMKNSHIWKNLCITAVILFLCTLVSSIFDDIEIRTENIMLIYLIGVLLIVVETRSFLWGITSSLLSILTFNYLFTNPTFSLQIDDFNYIITIIVFLIVSFVTGSLVNKLQQHAHKARSSARQTTALYEITRAYLTLSGVDTILQHTIRSLYTAQQTICIVYYKDKEALKKVQESVDTIAAPDDGMAAWCMEKDCDCGGGTSYYEVQPWTYHPMHCNNQLLGVYALYEETSLREEQRLFVHTLISQMVMAVERELLYAEQEQSRIEIEKEKLRNNLLRSISHDLRTPLTGIAGSSTLICENYQDLDDDTIYHLVKSISSDALWLNQLVENLLNMTRIQDGKLLLKQNEEVVDDIICEAVSRCESRKREHTLRVTLPDEVLLVEMDGRLIIQVLVNMIDNAIKHTPDATSIDIRCYKNHDWAVFEVIDQGEGIDESIREHLFESFVTTKSERSDSRRGVGLGLTICKSIVEAHHGEIFAYNRLDVQGAVFGFQLKLAAERKEYHA